MFANAAWLPVLKDLRHSVRADNPPSKRLFGGFSARLTPSLVRGAVECLHSKTNLLSSKRLINVAVAATPSALNPYSISLSRGRSGRRETSDERGGQGGEWRGKTQDTCTWGGGMGGGGLQGISHFKFACCSAQGSALKISPEIVWCPWCPCARTILTKTKGSNILLN